MENRINIAELLKDCPKGIELDCLLFDSPVKYDGLDNSNAYPIRIVTENGAYFYLTKEGYLYIIPNSKCIIFPKNKTTWEGFEPPCQFKDGDIVATIDGTWIGITTGGKKGKCMPTYCVIKSNGVFEAYLDVKQTWSFSRFATEEEKQKLFKTIEANGYKWNPETKTLKKIVKPEFKVGDKITNGSTSITIGYIDDEYYYEIGRNIATRLFIENQDEWKLVPDKFDVTTLKPFNKVLVRDHSKSCWDIAFYKRYDKINKFYLHHTLGGIVYRQCIPYEGNEHLLGKTDDCNEYYKTWE